MNYHLQHYGINRVDTTTSDWLPTVTSSVYLKIEILVQVGMKRMGKFIKSVNPNSNLNNDRCFLYGFFIKERLSYLILFIKMSK